MDMQPTNPEEAAGLAEAVVAAIFWLWQRLKSLCYRVFRWS
jgi:hypothetical protein